MLFFFGYGTKLFFFLFFFFLATVTKLVFLTTAIGFFFFFGYCCYACFFDYHTNTQFTLHLSDRSDHSQTVLVASVNTF